MAQHVKPLEAFRNLLRAVEALSLAEEARPSLYRVETAAEEIRRGAMALQTMNERRCNESFDDAGEARLARREDLAEKRVSAAVASLGEGFASAVEIEFQGDPRGASVKLWRRGERDKGSPLCWFW